MFFELSVAAENCIIVIDSDTDADGVCGLGFFSGNGTRLLPLNQTQVHAGPGFRLGP